MNSQPDADVVKKSYLRFKATKTAGPSGGLLGPKGFKDFWFVFRSRDGGEKLFEYYATEKKFQERAMPKGVIYLGTASSVKAHSQEKRQQFCLEMTDDTVFFFEAGSVYNAQEWISCLNAVLFGRGPNGENVLQYEADLRAVPVLPYAGPCLLEIKDGEVIVWTRESYEEVIRWKLAHIRSFKAKKNLFTLHAGSRSSTGAGEFYFESNQSVQITHAIETIVREMKSRQHRAPQTLPVTRPLSTSTSSPALVSRSRNSQSERRPLPAPPLHMTSPTSPPHSYLPDVPSWIPDHLAPNDSKLSASAVANIPNFRPPEYEDLTSPQDESPPQEYGRLEHADTRQPQLPSSDVVPESYARLSRTTNSTPQVSKSRTNDYEDMPDDGALGEPYGRLDHLSTRPPLSRPVSMPLGQKSPMPSRKKPPPPKPLPYKQKANRLLSMQPTATNREEVYSEIDQDISVNIQTSVPEGYNRLDRSRVSASLKNRPVVEGYGKLNRRGSNSDPDLLKARGEHYGALEHFPRSKTPSECRAPLHSTFDPYGSLSLSQSYREAPCPNQSNIFIDANSIHVEKPIIVGAKQPAGEKPATLQRKDSEQITSDEFYAQLGQVLETKGFTPPEEEEPYSRTTQNRPTASKKHGYVNVDDSKFAAQNGLTSGHTDESYGTLNHDERSPSNELFECLYECPKEDKPPVPPKRDVSIRGTSPQAPSGPTSPQGPSGPTSPQAPSGPTSPQGPSGPTSPQAPSGPTSPQGPSGPTSPQGPSGPTSPQGPSDPTSPQAPSGPTSPPIYTKPTPKPRPRPVPR